MNQPPDKDNELFVRSAFSPETNEPKVIVDWEGNETFLTVTEARIRATELIEAIAHLKTQLALMTVGEKLSADESQSTRGKGFAKNFKSLEPAEPYTDIGILLITLMRDCLTISPEIAVTFGRNRKTGEIAPYLLLGWHSDRPLPDGVFDLEDYEHCLAPIETAYRYSRWLFEAAESATTDAFLWQFFRQKLQVSYADTHGIFDEFQAFRSQNLLEDLLRT